MTIASGHPPASGTNPGSERMPELSTDLLYLRDADRTTFYPTGSVPGTRVVGAP